MNTLHNFKQTLKNIRGFSLVEVMVALVVLSVGLLGLAKIQSLAYSSTATASLRSLAAIHASSLAATMRANRMYWSTASAPIPITITSSGGTTTFNPVSLAATINCVAPAASCTSDEMARYDLQQWAVALSALLPNSVATITCPASSPVTCTVQLTWNEKTVAINREGIASPQTGSYLLFVEP